MANSKPSLADKAKANIFLIVIVILVFIVGANGCSTYNGLVSENQEVENAWGNVQNQYQRRLDLIPNLVETVKGYAAHESGTFEKVTAMRAGLDQACNQVRNLENSDINDEQKFQEYTNAQSQLQKAYSLYINAVHEAYPDLKANENFKDLQVQLEGTENRIATQRTYYNEAVKNYNLKVLHFPGNLWAGIFGFRTKPMFTADQEAQSAPRVSF